MNILSTRKGYPTVTAWIVAALMMLALTMQVNPAAAVTLDEAVDGQQLLCRVLGSHPDVPVTRTTADGRIWVQVRCDSGLLDGATCDIFPGTQADGAVTSSCSMATVAGGPHVAPVAGIQDVSDPGPGGPGGAGNVAVDPVVAEDPTRSEPVVNPVQPGFSVDEIVKALTDGCHVLGGEDVEIARSEADAPPGSVDVRCIGGQLYDVHCTVAVKSLTCQWLEPQVVATVDVVLTDVKVEGHAPTPSHGELVDPTASPVPTPSMDDDSGMDPTVPPPPPRNDDSAPPPGEAEDPKLTPTEVILL